MKWMVALLCVFLVAAAARAELTIESLQGSWISDEYAKSLEQTRSVVSRPTGEIQPVSFTIHKAGDSWRIDVTTFHEGTWRTIDSLHHLHGKTYELTTGPYETVPPFDDLKRFLLDVTTDAAGRPAAITGAIWDEEKVQLFRRLDAPVDQWAGRLLIAGRYRDAKGGAWVFDERGSGTSPEGPFKWEPVLDSSEACTDYMILRRPGMKKDAGEWTAWRRKNGKLDLSAIVLNDESECPISAAKNPFAVLTPERKK